MCSSDLNSHNMSLVFMIAGSIASSAKARAPKLAARPQFVPEKLATA